MVYKKPIFKYIFWTFFLLFTISHNFSQTTIKGKIFDSKTNEDLIGATIKIVNSGFGCVTDFNGEFILKTNLKLPLTLEVSYIGYEEQSVNLNENEYLKIYLKSKDLQLKAVEVLGGISKKLKESPLSIESMDINDIKQTSATNFYEGLSHMKGVDMTSASLGFRVINTRGFNSTSPVRSLQIIDGVDNASPGLNFALGNFLGASELDLMKVEIVSGASSAFYGPNAFNGVISMETKNPFLFPGFSASVKMGERFLNEYAVRYAKVIKNKNGKERFAYKLNIAYMNADDWIADNTSSVADLKTDETNPGGYDAVNRYGDENLNSHLNQMLNSPITGEFDSTTGIDYPGLARWHRKGYWEQDLVDYKTENLKTSLGLYYKFENDIMLSSSSNFSTGTTVYQGDNRFSLKDIKFFQNKIELKKDNDFFIRVYATHEDAGNSYDAVLTAYQMQMATNPYGERVNVAIPGTGYHEVYKEYWRDNITDRVISLSPDAWIFGVGNPISLSNVWNAIGNIPGDSLIAWHQETANHANGAHPNKGMEAFYEPGTERFDSLFNKTISAASVLNGGSKIVDKSALYHGHGEKIFDGEFAKFTIGTNFRIYTPRSNGSLFSDTATNHTGILNNGEDTLGMIKIINKEVGGYMGLEKSFLSDQLIIKASIRLDKNQNFDLIPTQAISAIYNINEKHTVRSTFTSAIRNPTLLNQYQYYNIGRAILAGNINGYEDLCTPESVGDKLSFTGELVYFDVAPIKPEEVKCLEFGYRGVFNDKLYFDANYYYNWYTNFIGFINGVDVYVVPPPVLSGTPPLYINDVFRIATNSSQIITTQGLSVGLNYYLSNQYSLNGNYSWNKLNKENDDPIIPAYNTPEHKFNLGFSGKEIDFKIMDNTILEKLSFNLNYKWIQGFNYEGSPQFTGYVPSYGLLDFQLTKNLQKQNLSIKLGASNILNNKALQVYGGPFVGRMMYLSLLFDLKD